MENVTINILELASELATLKLLDGWEEPSEIYEYDADGNSVFTEAAQDLFNEYYDEYTELILTTKVD